MTKDSTPVLHKPTGKGARGKAKAAKNTKLEIYNATESMWDGRCMSPQGHTHNRLKMLQNNTHTTGTLTCQSTPVNHSVHN